jgi:hypothetical protein
VKKSKMRFLRILPKKTLCSLKTNHFFPLIFVARAKKARFRTRAAPLHHPALVRKRSLEKCVKKATLFLRTNSYFFNPVETISHFV